MKTSINNTIKATLLILALSFTTAVTAQQVNLGIKTTISGSGLANAPAFTATALKGHSLFECGLRYQPRQQKLSGAETTFGYKLTDGYNGHTHLYALSSMSFNFSSALSRGTCNREQMVARETTRNFSDVRLNTVEYQVGFSLIADHGKYLHSEYGIGFGGYNTIGQCGCQLYRDRSAVTLMLSAGLSFSISK